MNQQVVTYDQLLKEAYPQTTHDRIAKAKSLIRSAAKDDELLAMVYHLLDWKEHETHCKELERDPGQWLAVDGKHEVPEKLTKYYRTRCNRAAGVLM